jgi:UrcA family protein
MRNTILITTAAFLAAAAFAPAHAQPAPRSQAVSTIGLDLGAADGRARFQRRLAAAVETVCGSYAGASDIEQRDIGRCRRAALSSAEMQLAARRGGTVQVATPR